MTLLWLKRYVPRGLYGRTALILVLPVVAVQLVVSVAFIQRHLEDVTSQMTVTMTRELQLVTAEVDAAALHDAPAAAAAAARPSPPSSP